MKSILTHPNYTQGTNEDMNTTIYDLALLKLEKKIKFSKIVKRARLPKPTADFYTSS